MPITGIAYTDLWVHRPSAGRWISAFGALGFTPAGQIHTPVTDGSTLIHPGSGARVIISAAHPGTDADRHVTKYGEGVRDLAFFTTTVEADCQAITPPGVSPPAAPRTTIGGGQIATATGPGGLRHTLLAAPPHRAAPGFDHVALAVPAGELEQVAGLYQRAGFSWERSPGAGVARSGTAVLTLVTPRPGSPVEGFLATTGGHPGIQHLALPTPHITETVTAIRASALGIRFAAPSGSHRGYPGAPDQADLAVTGVTASPDRDGRLLRQVYTLPLAGSGLAAELIQRRDPGTGTSAAGFGTHPGW